MEALKRAQVFIDTVQDKKNDADKECPLYYYQKFLELKALCFFNFVVVFYLILIDKSFHLKVKHNCSDQKYQCRNMATYLQHKIYIVTL